MENQDDREKETSIVSAEKWNDGALNEAADWPLAGEWVSECGIMGRRKVASIEI